LFVEHQNSVGETEDSTYLSTQSYTTLQHKLLWVTSFGLM